MTNRNFDEWLSKFRPSISSYDYYIDFEKVIKNVDEIKVEVQRTDDGGLVQHGRVAAEVGVVVFQHLGVIGGQAHEDQQTDGAEHKVHDAEAKAEQAEQPAHKAADDQGNQAAHELGAPAGQVTVGDVAVHRHNAEVDRTDEERQNQAAEVIHEEDGA